MEVDIFKEILVPVIGGLGIFMLGLEFMANGIQALSVNKMRQWLAAMAGHLSAWRLLVCALEGGSSG